MSADILRSRLGLRSIVLVSNPCVGIYSTHVPGPGSVSLHTTKYGEPAPQCPGSPGDGEPLCAGKPEVGDAADRVQHESRYTRAPLQR
jgi:hypothetical protein